jgi:hypothetical protein
MARHARREARGAPGSPTGPALHADRRGEARRRALRQHRRDLVLAAERGGEGGTVARLPPVRADRRRAQRRAGRPHLRARRAIPVRVGRRAGRDPRRQRDQAARGGRRLRRTSGVQARDLRREDQPRGRPRADRRGAPGGLVPAVRGDLRHAAAPDGAHRRRGRSASGGLHPCRLRPRRVADAGVDRAQAPRAQGSRLPRAGLRRRPIPFAPPDGMAGSRPADSVRLRPTEAPADGFSRWFRPTYRDRGSEADSSPSKFDRSR